MLIGSIALAVRLPAFFASAHLTFDDGVFGASAVAMRHGGTPFREVFSSQGPLFLPLVWIGDVVGFRTANAPRVLSVIAGVAVALLVWRIARRLAGPAPGLVAALVVAVSGSVLWTTGPLAADGPGLALALGAVTVGLAHREEPTLARAIAMGALIGASFAIKSLFAVPPAVVVAWVLLERREWTRLAAALGTSAALVLAVALPWGIAEVWDQAVDYHLDAAGERTPGRNAAKVFTTTWDRDLLPLATLTAGLSVAGWARLRTRQRTVDWRVIGPVVAWLGTTLTVLVLEHPLWRPHLTHLVPPVVLIGVYAARRHLRVVVPALALVLVAHIASNTDVLWPDGYDAQEARAVAELRRLPRGSFVISDEPGFVWRAGLRTPDDLVDASILRIESGRMTSESVAAAAGSPVVCAVLVWSPRFGAFELGPALRPHGYSETADYGRGRTLFTRACATTASS